MVDQEANASPTELLGLLSAKQTRKEEVCNIVIRTLCLIAHFYDIVQTESVSTLLRVVSIKKEQWRTGHIQMRLQNASSVRGLYVYICCTCTPPPADVDTKERIRFDKFVRNELTSQG